MPFGFGVIRFAGKTILELLDPARGEIGIAARGRGVRYALPALAPGADRLTRSHAGRGHPRRWRNHLTEACFCVG